MIEENLALRHTVNKPLIKIDFVTIAIFEFQFIILTLSAIHFLE